MKIYYLLLKISLVCISLVLSSVITTCSQKKDSALNSGDPVSAFVSIAPQAYIVERIGGTSVSVHTLVDKGQEPHTFQYTPHQLMELTKAELFFKIGMPFERELVSKLQQNNANLRVIESTEGIEFRIMQNSHHDEEHGEEHKNDVEMDPHVWLGVAQLRLIAENIFNALKETLPEQEEYFKRNMTLFLKDLDEIHMKLSEILKPYKGRTVFVFHPAFGYFTDTYNLIQEAIEIEGKSPLPKQLKKFIEKAREEEVSIIFVQKQFDTKSSETIAEAINGVVIPLDPLSKDILRNFEDIAGNIEKALKK